MITLTAASARVGQPVIYAPAYGRPEPGTIVSANNVHVFVQYSWGVAATRCSDLVWPVR